MGGKLHKGLSVFAPVCSRPIPFQELSHRRTTDRSMLMQKDAYGSHLRRAGCIGSKKAKLGGWQCGLERDVTYSISGGKREMWIGRREGLTHLQSTDNSFTTKTYTQADGLAQNSVYAVHQNRDGSVWAGTVSGGLSWFRNGQFKTFTTTNGLGSNSIVSILESSDGTMWFGTPNGLSEFLKDNGGFIQAVTAYPPAR